MANTDKNILITPNIGSSTDDPKIVFSGADSSTSAQNITLKVYPQNNGTLSFEGSAGQLFSINNSLSGTIYSVNDVSGIPSIEVLDTGTVRLAQYSGNVGIGIANPNYKLDINGDICVNGIKFGRGNSGIPTDYPDNDFATNIAIGVNTLLNNISGDTNIAIGSGALFNSTSGYENVGIGQGALLNVTSAISNVAIGHHALGAITDGFGNTAIGNNALQECTGSSNIAIGNNAGNQLVGSNNVIIGMWLGNPEDTLNNNVIIADGEGNVKLQISDTGYTEIYGDLTATGNITAYSDERLKTNWKPVQENFVSKLASVKSGIFDRTDVEMTQAGVSAQSLQEVLPEAINTNADGMLSVSYGNAALVAAIEIAKIIEEQKKMIENLQQRITALEAC